MQQQHRHPRPPHELVGDAAEQGTPHAPGSAQDQRPAETLHVVPVSQRGGAAPHPGTELICNSAFRIPSSLAASLHQDSLGMLPCNNGQEGAMYRHILIPTDGSSLSEQAIRQGVALAKSLHAGSPASSSRRRFTRLPWTR